MVRGNGNFACDGDGKLHTIWRREKTIYRCTDGGVEEPLGTGEQGRAADGPRGVYFTWIGERPGPLFVLPPEAREPRRLADRAVDPAIAAGVGGKGPVIVAWEQPDTPGGPIRALTLNP